MGNCLGRRQSGRVSTTANAPYQLDVDAARKNSAIEASIKREQQRIQSEVKLLLLGAGESGKSTILKQMKLIHEGGYSGPERAAFRFAVYSNVTESAKRLCEERVRQSRAYTNGLLEQEEQIILEADPKSLFQSIPGELVGAIKAVYSDPTIKELLEHAGADFYLLESTKYYLDRIDVIGSPDYLPTDQDILRSRIKTTGITETLFKIGQLNYRMFDVGGQRSERKKWRNCFSNATAIIFMVAISEYDQVLLEDSTANRMRESLALFSSIINYRPFTQTPIILFFNKIDIFEQKLAASPIEHYFPDYQGGPFYDAGCQYFKELFLALDKSGTNRVYVHFTCATDTEQIKFVMEAVNDIFIQSNLRAAGLL